MSGYVVTWPPKVYHLFIVLLLFGQADATYLLAIKHETFEIDNTK